MNTEVNPKTGLPMIVAFRETLDGSLIVFTFNEAQPLHPDDWNRKGPCAPMYFAVVRDSLYLLGDRAAMWTLAERVPLLTMDELVETLDSTVRRMR